MNGKTLQEWYQANEIDWEVYWNFVDTMDPVIKKRQHLRKSPMPPRWWKAYHAPTVFRRRFREEGTLRGTYKMVAEKTALHGPDGLALTEWIIKSMVSLLGHPARRLLWEPGLKGRA